MGLDHQQILGETRPEILAEKLGLLKPGVPFYCGVDEELRGQAFAAAVAAGSPVHFLDELARWDDAPGRLGPGPAPTRVFGGCRIRVTPVLRRNVALALLALDDLERRGRGRLLPDDPAAALGNLFLPGRYQRVLSGPDWIFDTAHNAQALRGGAGSVPGPAGARPPRAGVRGHAGQAGAAGAGAAGRGLRPGDRPAGVAAAFVHAGRPGGAPAGLVADAGGPGPRNRRTGRPWRRTARAGGGGGGPRDLAADDAVLVTGSCFTVAEVLWHLGVRDLDETRARTPGGPGPGRPGAEPAAE